MMFNSMELITHIRTELVLVLVLVLALVLVPYLPPPMAA